MVVPLKQIVETIENFYRTDGDESHQGSQQVLDFVRATAKQLGLSRLIAGQLQLDDEETIEILCREINAALEAGNIGFEQAI